MRTMAESAVLSSMDFARVSPLANPLELERKPPLSVIVSFLDQEGSSNAEVSITKRRSRIFSLVSFNRSLQQVKEFNPFGSE